MAANLQQYARRKWRDKGYYVEAGEHVFRGGGRVRRRDTFGFADLICIKPGSLVFLQVTSRSNVSSRINKIARESHGSGQWTRRMSEVASALMSIPGVDVVVEGWDKNTQTFRWRDREETLTPDVLVERGGTLWTP